MAEVEIHEVDTENQSKLPDQGTSGGGCEGHSEVGNTSDVEILPYTKRFSLNQIQCVIVKWYMINFSWRINRIETFLSRDDLPRMEGEGEGSVKVDGEKGGKEGMGDFLLSLFDPLRWMNQFQGYQSPPPKKTHINFNLLSYHRNYYYFKTIMFLVHIQPSIFLHRSFFTAGNKNRSFGLWKIY